MIVQCCPLNLQLMHQVTSVKQPTTYVRHSNGRNIVYQELNIILEDFKKLEIVHPQC